MYRKRNNELEVISLFRGNNKARYFLRQLSNLSGLPLRTCQTTVSSLEKQSILRSKLEGKNKYFSLNLDNIQVKSYLLQAEIYQMTLFLEKYHQIKTFIKEINTNIPILVFGSYAKMSANENSDLDLLIIGNDKLPIHLLPFQVHKVQMLEKTFLKALHSQETLIKEIEENHIILNNHSFFVNAMWGQYAR